MNFSIRSLLVVLLLCAIAAAIIASDVRRKSLLRTEDSQLIVAILVSEYLDANNNEWPKDWSSLSPLFEKMPQGSRYTFSEIQNRVDLDFSIDGSELLQICTSPKRAATFRPIRPKHGVGEFEMMDPNAWLLDHVGRMIMY